jgi:hypothetical protein
MANQNYTVNISFGKSEPLQGRYSSDYNTSFSGEFDFTTGFQSGSAMTMIKRFAEYVSLSANSAGPAISAALNGLDSLGVPADF